jgi:thiamine pyrophosphokinase
MLNEAKNGSHWLLIADGEPLSAAKLMGLAQHRRVLVLDGAYSYAKQIGLNIEVLLGDFDTIDPAILEQVRLTTTTVVHTPDQNKTDLEKGLAYLDEQAAQSVIICAAIGKRLQHTLYNLRLLKKCHRPQRSLVIYSETEMIRYLHDSEIRIIGKVGDSVGVLGFPVARVTSVGLKYEMKNYQMIFEQQSSVLNELAQTEANIRIKGDALVIYESK